MYRKKYDYDRGEFANLDSLMDILTCVVGVMLFVVIFAVMEARGVNIKMFTPLAQEPSNESTRNVFLCSNGRIRHFDIESALKKLFLIKEKLTFDTVPKFVNIANQKKVSDNFFTYELDYKEWTEESFLNERRRRAILAIVREIPGTKGEGAEEIQRDYSNFRETLSQLDSKRAWIAFLVDKESLDIFRQSREIALSLGFTVGWDPGELRFPYKEVILGGGSRKKSKYAPRDNLGTWQNK